MLNFLVKVVLCRACIFRLNILEQNVLLNSSIYNVVELFLPGLLCSIGWKDITDVITNAQKKIRTILRSKMY